MNRARLSRLLQGLVAAGVCLGAGVTDAAQETGVASSPTASLSARAHTDFTVRIPRTLLLRLANHPGSIDVTPTDIANGVVVVTGTLLQVVANGRHGSLLKAELTGNHFDSVEIEGLPAPFTSGRTGVAALPSQIGAPRPAPYAVSYRLRLASGTLPGRYQWPVALNLQDP